MRTIGLPKQDGWHWMYHPIHGTWNMTFVDECDETIVLMSHNGKEARRIVPLDYFEGLECEWWPIPAPVDNNVAVLVDRETLDEAKRTGRKVVVQHVEGPERAATAVDIVGPEQARVPG